MNDKPTLAQLNDDTTLRWAAGRILNPGPCAHRWEQMPLKAGFWCAKCHRDRASYEGYQDCPIPDPVTDPLEVVAEQLVHHALETVGFWKLWESVRCVLAPHMSNRSSATITEKWLRAPAAEKIHCCLLALNHMEVTP